MTIFFETSYGFFWQPARAEARCKPRRGTERGAETVLWMVTTGQPDRRR